MASDQDPFRDMIDRALQDLPPQIRAVAETMVISTVDWPPRAVLQDLQIDDPLMLTGLYDGIPLTELSVTDQPDHPTMIWLYREPILAEWQARGDVDLADLVAHVLVHELAHHFGWSDADIARIDRWWE